MDKPTLVVMAAGMGSRFGGTKQITPVDEYGHVIMDFSIYDAMRAGFGNVVCIIKREFEEAFRRDIGDHIAKTFPLTYAYQALDMLPEGFSVPEGRVKPWGTGHAALSAKGVIDGPFCVINADDFYGAAAFETALEYLSSDRPEDEHAMVGYRIENTLTENGTVSRGICKTDGAGMLLGIDERTHVLPQAGGAQYTEDGGATFTFVERGTIVSMNMWCFGPGMMAELESRFAAFLCENLPIDPLECEYQLPVVPSLCIRDGTARVRVLDTHEKWFGVTYLDDLAPVSAAIADMKRAGKYPDRLWESPS